MSRTDARYNGVLCNAISLYNMMISKGVYTDVCRAFLLSAAIPIDIDKTQGRHGIDT